MNKLIPNLNTFADLIDRLIVEVNKLAWFENMKREEQAKPNKDPELIAHWDNLSRDACEYRSALKNAINQTLKEIVRTGDYDTLSEIRTFRAPPKAVDELLADMCYAAPKRVRHDLAQAFSDVLKGEN